MDDQAGTNPKSVHEISVLKQKLKELEQSGSSLRSAEKAMSASKDVMEAVLDNLNDFLLVIDPVTYTILGANRPFVGSCGLNKDTVIGKYCYELTHNRSTPCSPPDHVCPLAETLKTGEPSTVEHLHYDSTGNKLYIEVSARQCNIFCVNLKRCRKRRFSFKKGFIPKPK
ncbi:MAG: PAS domain-containing protein [Syntrophales bacterium]|nr:PAS domain-containing protein [Syntrophales bacterium]